MPTHSTAPTSVTLRDIRRDRSILALAAALCGALSAAGLAALAVVTQLSTNHGESAMSDATAALTAATERLESSRAELRDGKRALASAKKELKATRRELRRCGARSGHDRTRRRGSHSSRMTRAPAFSLPPKAPKAGQVGQVGQAAHTASLNFAAPLTTITHAGLTCSSEHRCQIHSEFLDAALADSEGIARRGRVVPAVRDGTLLGLKVYGLRSGGTLKLLGFKNGDLLTSVNGHSLADRPLEYLTKLSAGHPKTVSIDLERKGEKVTKHFEIL